MASHQNYKPLYSESRALVIGINKYHHLSPLFHARNDAEAIANTLTTHFKFSRERVALLTDGAATRARILETFLSFATDATVCADDRILIFFAGHGHTFSGRKGETGFLVPVDGKADDLSTLIRWDELTRNAELIAAKHLLFIMDACYGGLALTRKPPPPGSMRFLKDMLQRYSRQVLTAGKADEAVNDSGGPRSGHSIFTGHVLDALEGGAATSEGIISANGLMAYVYERVSSDINSRQTPHYGFIDGDGDFIFDTTPIETLGQEGKTDADLLIKLAPFQPPPAPTGSGATVAESIKSLLSDSKYQIQLDDFITGHVKSVLDGLNLRRFPVQGPFNADEFNKRLKLYESAVSDLETIAILGARWADQTQIPTLVKMFTRLGEADRGMAGTTGWLRLGWYPAVLLFYAAGIAALSSQRYGTLSALLRIPVPAFGGTGSKSSQPLIVEGLFGLTEIVDAFKMVPGHERNYSPLSEYLFKTLQPPLEDCLFLGRSYESLFDRFEILIALLFAECTDTGWGPPGRFAWKHRGRGQSPYRQLIQEAEEAGTQWEPLKFGLFGGSLDKFLKISRTYAEQVLDRLSWY
jgi:hypothetical protein